MIGECKRVSAAERFRTGVFRFRESAVVDFPNRVKLIGSDGDVFGVQMHAQRFIQGRQEGGSR